MVSIFQNYEIFRYTGKISIKISGTLEKLVLKFPVDGFGQRICLATGMTVFGVSLCHRQLRGG